MKYFPLFLFIVMCSFFSCDDIVPCDPDDQNALILQYIQDNNLVTQNTESGIYYIIDEPGAQIRPDETSTVSVIYKGMLTDGTVFDDSNGNSISFPLNGVIAGWTEGIQLFREGGKGTLIIPCNLGYGERQTGSIPPSSVLVFEVELIDVK